MTDWRPFYKLFPPVAGQTLLIELEKRGIIKTEGKTIKIDMDADFPEFCIFCKHLQPSSSAYIYVCGKYGMTPAETKQAQKEGCIHPEGIDFEMREFWDK